jgi:hypothetical protein
VLTSFLPFSLHVETVLVECEGVLQPTSHQEAVYTGHEQVELGHGLPQAGMGGVLPGGGAVHDTHFHIYLYMPYWPTLTPQK